MKPTLIPSTFFTVVGGSTVRPVEALNQLPYFLAPFGFLTFTFFLYWAFAARYLKSAPPKPSLSKQPAVGWQPPYCIRNNSVTPSSNSWLPTLETSTSMVFSVSMLGSSLNRPDSDGEPPISRRRRP